MFAGINRYQTRHRNIVPAAIVPYMHRPCKRSYKPMHVTLTLTNKTCCSLVSSVCFEWSEIFYVICNPKVLGKGTIIVLVFVLTVLVDIRLHCCTIEFYWVHTSVFFRYMVDILVSNNVQQSLEKRHFLCRYGASHKATHPRVACIEDAVICFIICKPWTVSCLHCTIAMKKVLFFPLTTVCCWTPKCTPCNGEIRMCASSENLNMCSCICCMQWLVCHFIACSQGSSMHVLL